MSQNLILWGVGTSRTVRAHWAMHELELKYECRPILPRSGETKTPRGANASRGGCKVTMTRGCLIVQPAELNRQIRRWSRRHCPGDFVADSSDYEHSQAAHCTVRP